MCVHNKGKAKGTEREGSMEGRGRKGGGSKEVLLGLDSIFGRR